MDGMMGVACSQVCQAPPLTLARCPRGAFAVPCGGMVDGLQDA